MSRCKRELIVVTLDNGETVEVERGTYETADAEARRIRSEGLVSTSHENLEDVCRYTYTYYPVHRIKYVTIEQDFEW